MSSETRPQAPGIVLSNVTRRFGDFTALDSISLEVQQGEIYGILGPNGAGKTTLLNILCGLSRPTEGSVAIFGMDFEQHHDEIRKLLGYVPQETALYEHLTAEENLLFHARFYGVPRSEQKARVEEALQLARLESRRKSRVKEFSGGMKRRLALVRALVHDPQLLMLDEPSLGIDVQSRVEIWDRIKELKASKTVIVTTNYMEEADYLCDRVAILDEGRLVAHGATGELKKAHLGELVELTFKDAPQDFIDRLPEAFRGIAESTHVEAIPERGTGWLKVSLRVPDAGTRLPGILEITRDSRVETHEVNVRAPSLNDVFIELTGKRLRD